MLRMTPRPTAEDPTGVARSGRQRVPPRFQALLGIAAVAVNMPSIIATLRVQPTYAAATLSALLGAAGTAALFIPIELARFNRAPGSFGFAPRNPWSAILPSLRFRLLLFSLSAFIGRWMF